MAHISRLRAVLSLATAFSCAGFLGAYATAGCGGTGNGSPPTGSDATAPIGDDSGHFLMDDGGGNGDDGSTNGDGATGLLAISPLDDVLDVTEDANSGALTFSPLTYAATYSGQAVQAKWSLDRGELGAIDTSSGAFTPSGMIAGKGTITASYGSAAVSTSITIHFHLSQALSLIHI